MVSASEDIWMKRLAPEKYNVLRRKATEQPFTSRLLKEKSKGIFVCGACGQELFSSKTKFDSGSGWPSFWDVIKEGNVELKEDNSLGMSRTEVLCSRCKSHLGHVFNDGPNTTGKRYCINGAALDFKKEKGGFEK